MASRVRETSALRERVARVLDQRREPGAAELCDAVERAILKSSPLPQPDDRSLFQRQLELKFHPQDR